MTVSNKTLIAAALFASLGTVSTAAVAGDIIVNANSQRVMEVSYNDLNLDHPEGQSALERRISAAAKKVCGATEGRTSLQEASKVRSCVNSAKDTAMTSLNTTGQVQVAARSIGSASR